MVLVERRKILPGGVAPVCDRSIGPRQGAGCGLRTCRPCPIARCCAKPGRSDSRLVSIAGREGRKGTLSFVGQEMAGDGRTMSQA